MNVAIGEGGSASGSFNRLMPGRPASVLGVIKFSSVASASAEDRGRVAHAALPPSAFAADVRQLRSSLVLAVRAVSSVLCARIA
jgi:hypothetical protein